MNQKALPGPSAGSERAKTANLKSSSFMMENLLKPDKKIGPECPTKKKIEPAECPMEPPSKLKALSVAAHLAGLTFSYFKG